MRSLFKETALAAATCVLTAFVAGASQQPTPAPPAGTLATIPAPVAAAAEKIANDPQVLALLKEQSTEAAAKARWNQFLELVRIPSPSRQEHLKAAEIHRRLVGEWGFTQTEVMTRADGIIAGTDTNIVDGLPVYNACVVIKGSYSSRADAQHYKGQYPKVLVEGHIDVVNPEELPKAGDPSIRIKLQPYAQPVVATPEELAAIPDELSFDARGRVVENDQYATASKAFANAKEAEAGGGVRIYVPGYGDMMPSTSNAFVLAAAMKKHNIRPVYDIWICGTAGEEGKGNLAGVKQLYGFDQKAGTLTLTAEDHFKLEAVWDVLQTRLIKRGVAVKNLKRGDIDPAAGSSVRQVITLQQGIPTEAAREIVKHLKDLKLKKVQAAIQGDQLRVTSPSKDDLQGAMQALRAKDFGIALQFGNYR